MLTVTWPSLWYRWLGADISGMAIMEIGMLTGYLADNLSSLKSQSSLVKRVDSDDTKIVLYLDEVSCICC